MPIAKDPRTDIAERLRTTAEDLVELVTAQVKLARLEVLADARILASRVARFAVFVPLVLIGYGFLVAAGASALAAYLGLPWALALVGAVNVAAGAGGLVRASRALRRVRLLEHSREAIDQSLARVGPLSRSRVEP
jgi:protein-S-isoprenylcysteine O-methyltransferase Ste14